MVITRAVRSMFWRGALSLVLLGCERSQPAVVELPHDAALEPVVLTPAPAPPGILEFDCTGTEPGQSAQSLRTWKSPGAAGAATNLKGHAIACDLTLRSDCGGQAELRLSAGLARSEKVVTAVAAGKTARVQLRLPSGLWEKALEPEERTPYQDTLQLVARADVRCAAPVSEARPRYWTDSFIVGLMGEQKPSALPPREPTVAMQDGPATGEGDPKAKAAATPSSTAPTASERAAARAARRERRKKATSTLDLNLNPPAQPERAAEEGPATEE